MQMNTTNEKERNIIIKILAKKSFFLCLFIFCACIFSDTSFATPDSARTIPPEYQKETPKKKPRLPSQRLGITISPASILKLPPLDTAPLLAEDAARRSGPARIGVHRDLDVSPETYGEWHDIDGRGRIWLFGIHSPDAFGIWIHLSQCYLPKGAQIYLYSPSRMDKYEGSYTQGGDYWTSIIWDNTVIVEFVVPILTDPPPFFVINKIGHIYHTVNRQLPTKKSLRQAGGSCRVDATCYPEWAPEGDAVGVMAFTTMGQIAACSGTMLDNQAEDYTPYFLTTEHCIASDAVADTARIYWFYETSTCNGSPPDLNNVPKSENAMLFESKTAIDFSVLEILGSVPRSLSWAKWSLTEPETGDSGVGLHHPGGAFLGDDDYRRILFGNIASSSTDYMWDIDHCLGGTETGSSGSPLFNSSHQIIGQLRGGGEPCSPDDLYGKFSLSYPYMQTLLQGGSDDELEDNDLRSSATEVEDEVYKSQVVKIFDEDWYRISVPENTKISVDLSFIHNHGNINLELYQGDNPNSISSSSGTGDSEHVEHLNEGGATDYFFRIFLNDDTRNTYNMIIKFGEADPAHWIKTYGLYDGTAYAVQQTSDDGFIVSGIYDYRSWVFKLDAGGNIQWQKNYASEENDFKQVTRRTLQPTKLGLSKPRMTISWAEQFSIQQTSEGGYVVAGQNENDYDYDALVFKLDLNGNIQWQKRYGGNNYDFTHAVKQTSDGGYIVVGTSYSFGMGNGDCWVLKLDSSGVVQWQKTYGGTENDVAYSIQQTLDDGYIVAGATMSFGVGNGDFWVLKLDNTGNVIWQKAYGGNDQDVAQFVQQTLDGGYIVAGESYSFGGVSIDFWVVKLASNGGVEWQKAYDVGADSAYSVNQTIDGGYIIAGDSRSFSDYDYDALALKLDTNGNIEWQHRYGGIDDEAIYSIQQTREGEYIAAGYSWSFLSNYGWVLNLDSTGNIADCSGVGSASATEYNTNAITSNTEGLALISTASAQPAGLLAIDLNDPAIEVCQAIMPEPELFVNRASIDFNYVGVNGLEVRDVRVFNKGQADLMIDSIDITGANASEFSESNDCSNVAVLDYCTIHVLCLPTAAGQKTASLDIISNDPHTPSLNIELNGNVGNLVTVTKSGTGDGTVTSTSGIDCGYVCGEAYQDGTIITLIATPEPNSTFNNWTGCDSSMGLTCSLTVNSDRIVTANFIADSPTYYTLDVTKDGTGSGTVQNCLMGIDCGLDCTEFYIDGTLTVLTAVPAGGSTFAGWTGEGCSGTESCVATMDENKTITATFTDIPNDPDFDGDGDIDGTDLSAFAMEVASGTNTISIEDFAFGFGL